MANKLIGVFGPQSGLIRLESCEHVFKRQKISVDFYSDATNALKAFESRPYPLIIAPFFAIPGSIEGDRELERVWMEGKGRGLERYAGVGLYVIKRIRKSEANGKTPIIVADILQPDEKMFNNPEERILAVGADSYFPLLNLKHETGEALTRKIRRLLNK